MKYTRLTKEQFEELHLEFANFLATQSIDKIEWETIKKEKPELAEQELDVFSDLIWEGALNQTRFLEHFAKNYIFLFKCESDIMNSLIIRSLDTSIDFLTPEGLQWLGDNIFTTSIEIKRGKKTYEKERNISIFELIQQGVIMSQGELFKKINTLITK